MTNFPSTTNNGAAGTARRVDVSTIFVYVLVLGALVAEVALIVGLT